MKYYIIAGEASGDLHGSNLIKELKKLDPGASIRCWGGDKMQQAGGELVKHYRELAFMGFTEVLMNLRTIFRNLKFCKQDILEFKPDTLVLIDYPGFNLRIAKWAKEQGLKVIYYISPQVWAWKENRVKMMKQCIDKMLVILPFEKDYFKNKWNWDVEYVGHPLVEVIEQAKQEPDHNLMESEKESGSGKMINKSIVALLPGSRKQEILKKLPVMLEITPTFQDTHFIVAKAPAIDVSFYEELLKSYPNVSVTDRTYGLLKRAEAALVTSGTATLETALFAVPEVVCYKGSPISYQIAKRVIKVKYISLVNLIMDKLVVKELIQDELTPPNLTRELNDIIFNPARREEIKKDYATLKQLLAQGGNASANAARSITRFLSGGA
ncbi:MAG TPA: lipid-A-disaccharide synthase [Chitinophagaceae bacterium]|nr:lipid-A-disaccharide synthase [Chitinophagaceae bacterium]